MSKKDTRESILKLREDIVKISNKYLEKIYIEIKKTVDGEQTWEEGYNNIYKLFKKALEEGYAKTSYVIKNLYNKTTPFNINNIMQLAYSRDGITLEERLLKYWNKTKEKVITQTSVGTPEWDTDKAKKYLLNRYALILDTEEKNLESAVKKNKQPIPPKGMHAIQVIEGCGGDCHGDCMEYNGIYPVDEDIEWPPYHPGCTGIAYYDLTDDIDEIEDLDLDDIDLDESF